MVKKAIEDKIQNISIPNVKATSSTSVSDTEPKSLLEFPCDFPIKVMGVNHADLITQIAAIVSKHVEAFNKEGHITSKLSTKGNYLSLTIKITAHSQTQLDNIYRELNQHQLVKLTL